MSLRHAHPNHARAHAQRPRARSTATVLAPLLLLALAACDAGDTAALVPEQVLSVSILEGPREVQVGAALRLEAQVEVIGAAPTTVAWSTSDAAVAAVDEDGLVAGLAAGEATVRATSSADTERFDEVTITVSEEEVDASGVRLEGDPDAAALDATYDLSLPMAPGPEDVSVHEDEMGESIRVLRTEVELHLDPRATVGEVNALLERYDAWIVDMLAGHLALVVQVPDPGSLAALEALADELEDDPLVRFVLMGYEVQHDSAPARASSRAGGDPAPTQVLALPDGLGNQLSRVEHHLAVRAHAAWNLRAMLPGTTAVGPRLVVGDLFGDGPVDEAFNVVITPGDFAEDRPDSHGYHVLGIIAASFHAGAVSDTARDRITGIYPSVLRTRVADLRAWRIPTISRVTNRLIRHVNTLRSHDPDRGIVMNTSLHHRGHPFRNRGARSWVEKVRGGPDHATTVGAGLENHFVHVTSAGNDPDRDAVDNSAFTVAALGTMATITGTVYPNLTNTLVVENRVNTRHRDDHPDVSDQEARPLPGCAWRGGTLGGDISAIGRSVWSLGLRDGDGEHHTTTPSTKTGTSMAAPQVAGVAAMVLAVDPSLSGPEVADLLRDTATPAQTTSLYRDDADDCASTAPQPVLDAYSAILAAAGDDGRTRLLDVSGDGSFHHGDIEALLAGFAAEGAGLSYGRFDLSGDGRAGSWTRTERFDLTGDLDHGAVNVVVETLDGSTVSVTLDERAVNDHDVLCYYAYADLYSGDEIERNTLLGDVCSGRPTVEITSPEEGDIVSTPGGATLVAEMVASQPEGSLPDPNHRYTIDWSYRLEDGTRVELGVSAPGETLVADLVCADVHVSATATHRDVQYLSRDTVAFTYDAVDPAGFGWQAIVWGPAGASPSYLPIQGGSLVLEAEATRLRCEGVEEAHPNRLLWAIEGAGTAPQRGSSFTLEANDVENHASVFVEAWHEDDPGGSVARHEVIPCTLLTSPSGRIGGLRACPAAGETSKIQEALGRLYEDAAEAQLAAWMLERELDLLFPLGAPRPFPNSPEQLSETLPLVFGPRRMWPFTHAYIESLRDLLDLHERGTLEGSLRSAVLDLEVNATEQLASLGPDLLAFALTTSEVAMAVYGLFEPEAEGGASAWRRFPVASDADGRIRPPATGAVPALAAVDGFLTGVVATHARGEVDLEVAYEAAAIASAIAALDATEE